MVAGKKVPMRDGARIQAQIQAIWMRPIPRKIPGKNQAKIQEVKKEILRYSEEEEIRSRVVTSSS